MAAATKFVAILMNSRNQAHAFHLETSSYAQHKALEKYYEKIVDLLDDYAEAYMGKYGRIGRIHVNSRQIRNPKRRALTLDLCSRAFAHSDSPGTLT